MIVLMSMPVTFSLTLTTEYMVTLSSSCGDQNTNGLLFPTAGFYTAIIETSSDGVNTVDTTNFGF